jgi:hypothetical protein
MFGPSSFLYQGQERHTVFLGVNPSCSKTGINLSKFLTISPLSLTFFICVKEIIIEPSLDSSGG